MSDQISGAAQAAPVDDACPQFDAVSMAFHWATALLVLAQFGTAWSIDHLAPSLAPMVLTVHRSAGIVLWALVMLRLLWRSTGMRKPPSPPTMTRNHRLGATLGEYVLYALLMIQPATGLLHSFYHGRPFTLFIWRVQGMTQPDRSHASLVHMVHEFGGYALAGMIGLHAVAALAHHFILKDYVLTSMLPKRGLPGGVAVPR